MVCCLHSHTMHTPQRAQCSKYASKQAFKPASEASKGEEIKGGETNKKSRVQAQLQVTAASGSRMVTLGSYHNVQCLPRHTFYRADHSDGTFLISLAVMDVWLLASWMGQHHGVASAGAEGSATRSRSPPSVSSSSYPLL
jgi:hypothetical protein